MHKIKFFLVSSVVLGLLLGLAGCGGGGGNSNVVTVTIDQASPVSLAPNATQQFTATVTGTSNTDVIWSVVEGAAGGGFSFGTPGLYTAPAAVGTYHVKATSVADPQVSTTATVNVASGGGGGGATLTVTLDASVDTSSGSVLAASFTSADLLDTSGSTAKAGTANGASAQFDMAGLAAGTYFVRVNGLANDLVPVRIDDPSANLAAFVGTRLMDVFISSKASPTYRMRTFPSGQGSTAVAKYSDGTTATPTRYSYAILLFASNSIEIRVLGTAALLTSYSAGGQHSFSTWPMGASNHGLSYGGNDGNCSGCHNSLDTHPASYGSVNDSNGWCYKCHYGKSGSTAGSVDPTQ